MNNDLDFLNSNDDIDAKILQVMHEQAKLRKGILTVHKSNKLVQDQLKVMKTSIENIENLFEDNRRELDKLHGLVDGISRSHSIFINAKTNIDGNIEGDVAGGGINK